MLDVSAAPVSIDTATPVVVPGFQTHIVRVSDAALAQMVLAAMEGFEVPHVVGNGFRRGVETYALLWGHEMPLAAETALHAIEMISVDTSATRTTNSVNSRFESIDVKREIIHSAWPNLRFIGDWHTHPHRTESISTITRQKLYKYSDDDYSDTEKDGKTYRRLGYRVGMVMTIGQSPRVLPALRIDDNTIRFSLGRKIFWLQAHVAVPHEDGLRFIRPRDRDGARVLLECPAAFGHETPLMRERQKVLRVRKARL